MDKPQPHQVISVVPPLSDEARQLIELGRLDDDWDTYGAKRITSDTLERANLVIEKVAGQYHVRPSDIYPMNSGAVQIEWRRADITFVVEVSTDVPFRYLLVMGDDEERRSIEKPIATLDEVMRAAAEIANT